jgi:hypothetical protein
MSVFDENRSRCNHCDGYINHWDWSDNEFHDTKRCLIDKQIRESKIAKLKEVIYNLQKQIKDEEEKGDYLLDLDHTLADI